HSIDSVEPTVLRLKADFCAWMVAQANHCSVSLAGRLRRTVTFNSWDILAARERCALKFRRDKSSRWAAVALLRWMRRASLRDVCWWLRMATSGLGTTTRTLA